MDLAIAYGLLTALGYGSADYVAKLSSQRTGYLRTALYMQVLGGVLLLLLTVQDIPRLWQYLSETYLAIGLGLVNVVGTLSLYKSFEVGRLSIVSPISNSYPVVSIILAVTFLTENLSNGRLLGIVLALAGIVMVSMQKRNTSSLEGKPMASGVVYALSAFVAYGFLYFALKLVVVHLGALLPVLILRLVSAPILTAIFFTRRPSTPFTSKVLGLVIPIAILDVVGSVAYNLGVALGDVSVVSTISGMAGAVTVTLAWILLKDRLTFHQGIGVHAILAGVALLGYFG